MIVYEKLWKKMNEMGISQYSTRKALEMLQLQDLEEMRL